MKLSTVTKMKKMLAGTLGLGAFLIMGFTLFPHPAQADWEITIVQEKPAGKTFLGDLANIEILGLPSTFFTLRTGHGSVIVTGKAVTAGGMEPIDERLSGSLTRIEINIDPSGKQNLLISNPSDFDDREFKLFDLVCGTSLTFQVFGSFDLVGLNTDGGVGADMQDPFAGSLTFMASVPSCI